MHPTTVFPTAAPSGGWDAHAGDPPTLRAPAAPPSDLFRTPAPASSLRAPAAPPSVLDLSGSEWSDWDSDEEPRPGVRRPPRVGDTVYGFELVGELGRGAFARVYRARQTALGGREVALKVTLRPTREAERLARLQHTNVVPVHSVHGDGGLQLICMPFLGRVTFADLLRAHRSERSSRPAGRKSSATRAARTTVGDSSRAHPASDGRSPARAPAWAWTADGPPPIVGDPRAVVEALAQLADGLAHAHARGILHLDLKPANVLLADTGEPMLLDFNLSFDTARPDREVIGGTVPYMAPEQLLDMRARGAGVVDGRTDLFALGAMAFELLTGTLPFETAPRGPGALDAEVVARRQGPPSVCARNPEVTPAVEAVVRKLLAPDPADRYQTAAQLQEDLQRHLADQPLRHARDGSVAERLGKWRRRNPGLAVRLAAAALVGLALGLGSVVHQRAETSARAGAAEQAREARAALDTVRLDLIVPGAPADRARGAKRAAEVLAGYGLPEHPDWRAKPAARPLPPADRAALAGDLGELLFLLAHATWHERDARPEAERRACAADAWGLLRAARGCFDKGQVPPALDRLAAAVAPAAGEKFDPPTDLPEPGAVTGPRARFLDAVLAVRAGRYVTAADLLDATVTDQPDHAAAQFLLAYCAHQRGQYGRAVERYAVARALLPKDPRPAFHRGLIFALTRKPALAEGEFTKALALDPDHAEAYRHRGLAHYRLGVQAAGRPSEAAARPRFEAAEKDCTAALERGGPALPAHLLRAAARERLGDAAGAKADHAAAAALEPQTETDYLVRGTLRAEADPKAALADFRKAAELNPRSLPALHNQGAVLSSRLNDSAAALVAATRAAELYPEFAPARAGRAVVLAHLGHRDEAHKEMERALALSDDAEVTFQAACVYALTSAKNADDRAKALGLLKRALRDGYADLKNLASDPHLDPLRGLSEFRDVCAAAANLLK